MLQKDILNFQQKKHFGNIVGYVYTVYQKPKPIRWAFAFVEELAKWICPYWMLYAFLRIRKRIQITLQALGKTFTNLSTFSSIKISIAILPYLFRNWIICLQYFPKRLASKNGKLKYSILFLSCKLFST